MSTKFPDLFTALAAPFEPGEVKQLPKGGMKFDYITARTAMNRLDTVLGPENWWDEYVPLENSVICKLTIRLPDGSTVTKADAGGYAGMSDTGDDDKSGYSDAFKRAAAKFGVARYLYRDGVPSFEPAREAGPEAIDPDQVRAETLAAFGAWRERALAHAALPADTLNPFSLTNHLLKWGAGCSPPLIAPVGTTSFGPRERVAAELWRRHPAEVKAETRRYVAGLRPPNDEDEAGAIREERSDAGP